MKTQEIKSTYVSVGLCIDEIRLLCEYIEHLVSGFFLPVSLFSFLLDVIRHRFYYHPGSCSSGWARCPLFARAARPRAPLSNASYCKCRHQKWKLGRVCLWPSLLPAHDCSRATKGKTRQAETASTLLICHRRCVRSRHVALRSCPSRRESLIMKTP